MLEVEKPNIKKECIKFCVNLAYIANEQQFTLLHEMGFTTLILR